MDEQRVPDLEEMDEQQAQRFLEGLASGREPGGGERILADEDYVMEDVLNGASRLPWGRENLRAFQESFPDNADKPTIRIRRVLVGEGLWVAESVVDYGGGQVFHGAAILELKDGKVWRDTRYFAEPFEAPGWRAHLVERMEP